MALQRWAAIFVLLTALGMSGRPHFATEADRLRRHFDTVDEELRARDVSTLNATQRATRLELISWLRDYRDAGRFPRNDRFPDRAAPFFRDSRGVLCAMAYLIARSGRLDIVNRIAETRNNAYIRELVDDAALVGWLDDAGLTAAEAARIQPSYPCGTFFPCPAPPEPPSVDFEYRVASIATGGLSAATAGFALAKPTRRRGWAALIAGGVEVVTGATHFGVNKDTSKLSTANVLIGTAAIAAGVRALLKSPRSGSVDPPRSGKTVDFALLPSRLQVRVSF